MAVRRVRRNQEPRGWAWGLGVAIVKPALLATTRPDWIDGHKIPASGGCIVVANHISHVDPLTVAHFLWDHGRVPRYVGYPEGTITRDPATWPMTGKTGAARIALATRGPVIPIGQWGAHRLLAPYATKPDLFPRKTVTMKVGDPIDLRDLAAQEHTRAVVAEATERIMVTITALVAEVRGNDVPAGRFDPRTAGVAPTGNPHKEGNNR